MTAQLDCSQIGFMASIFADFVPVACVPLERVIDR